MMKGYPLLCALCCGVFVAGMATGETERIYASPDAPQQAEATTTTAVQPFVVVEAFANRTSTQAPALNLLKTRLEDAIINTQRFTYLERGDQFNNALAERQRLAQGVVGPKSADPNAAVALTPLSVAGYSIYGEILSFDFDQQQASVAVLNDAHATATLEVLFRFADIQTGTVLFSKILKETMVLPSTGSGFTDKTLNAMVSSIVQGAVAELLHHAYPVEVLTVNAKRKYFIASLSKEHVGKTAFYDIYDPATALPIGTARVVRLLPKMAFFEPLGELKIREVKAGMRLEPAEDVSVVPASQPQKTPESHPELKF